MKYKHLIIGLLSPLFFLPSYASQKCPGGYFEDIFHVYLTPSQSDFYLSSVTTHHSLVYDTCDSPSSCYFHICVANYIADNSTAIGIGEASGQRYCLMTIHLDNMSGATFSKPPVCKGAAVQSPQYQGNDSNDDLYYGLHFEDSNKK